MPSVGDAPEMPVPPGASASLGTSLPALSPLFSSPSELLYTFSPLVVLFVCFHAISSNSPSSPSLSISASIRAFRLHLAVVHRSLPSSFSLKDLVSPALLCLLLPYVSFLMLRVLPVCFLEQSIPPGAIAVTYKELFRSPAVFSVSPPSRGELETMRKKHVFLSLLPDTGALSPLIRFLLHPFYLSQSSVVFWLGVGPFLLYSCAQYIQRVTEEERGGMTLARHRAGPQYSSPRLRSAITILICVYMPAVFMTWLTTHVFPGAADGPPFRYLGVEGAIYALAAVVFFYDPVVHSGMFADPSIQFPVPLHVRNVTSVLVFFLFLFSPPPGDLLLLLSGALSAVLAITATSLPPFFGVSGAVAAISTVTSAVAFGAHLGVSHTVLSSLSSLFFIDYAPLQQEQQARFSSLQGTEDTRFSAAAAAEGPSEALTWTVAGLVLAFVGGMAVAGAIWSWACLVEGAVHAVRDLASVRARLTSAAVMVAFTYLPFSFSSLPSIGALLSDPLQTLLSLQFNEPSLYAVTCSERTVLLGSIGAKTAAFWTPFFGLGSRGHKLKYFIGPLLLFLLFVGMTSEHWRRIGPGFLGTVFSLYRLCSLPRQEGV
ncbi:conserved hypothetical protein [Neospora caninum Liverpool]|uniref:Transmembrane protein n=1 Tax=Neospora caninum (strain Liverpool) TaxID=572307 RepID=F0VMS4_NEOCL|nr:conserved hypothetical protein [Neospora caninum Liverpool]CBZ55020.1 conserved hypothetical protein [Neospora caninum Liverpool]CEL69745.1 TPA: hypothetical protein BN1204_054460 [Neospora caninum Liverpool]|eukprot:XP_003885048.1 conserved hypothetical protein [Neospora caninum Liverpool]